MPVSSVNCRHSACRLSFFSCWLTFISSIRPSLQALSEVCLAGGVGLERRVDISRSSEAGDYQRHWEIRTTWPLVFTLKSREECVEPISAAAPRGHDLRRGQAAGTELVTSVCRLHLQPAITILNEVHFEEKAERLCNKLLTSFPQQKKKSVDGETAAAIAVPDTHIIWRSKVTVHFHH